MEHGIRPVGRPRALDEETVADAVIAGGFEDVRVGAVALRLGVNAATLYRFVSDREHLIGLALTRVIRRLAWPDYEGDWRSWLEGNVRMLWKTLRAHPGMAEALMTAGFRSEELGGQFERLCQVLMSAGFSPADATLAADFVIDLTVDTARMREALGGTSSSSQAAEGDWTRALDPRIKEVLSRAVLGEPSEWFLRKLGIALDGIAELLPEPGSASATR